jgi:hypothetical protein
MTNISIEDFQTNFSVTVSRYELYPAEEPTCYCVGFVIKHKTKLNSRYIDTQVTLADTNNKTEDEIVQLAWAMVRDGILSWATSVHNKPTIIGSVITPTFS